MVPYWGWTRFLAVFPWVYSEDIKMSFDTPENLIGYCEIHCQTERALFSTSQINEMLKVAGYPEGYVREVEGTGFYSMHESMEDLCKLARVHLAKMKLPPPDNVISLSAYRAKLTHPTS